MPGIEARAPERTETSSGLAAIAEPMASLPAHARQRRIDLLGKVGGIGFVVLVEIGADFGRDGEAGRHRQAERRHLRQIGALAAEQILHLAAAIGLFRAEGIDPFRHQPLSRNRTRFAAKAEPQLTHPQSVNRRARRPASPSRKASNRAEERLSRAMRRASRSYTTSRSPREPSRLGSLPKRTACRIRTASSQVGAGVKTDGLRSIGPSPWSNLRRRSARSRRRRNSRFRPRADDGWR